MKEIIISNKIKDVCPSLKILQIEAKVFNFPTGDELWHEIELEGEKIKTKYQLSELNKRISISGTRAVYKKLGKDPNRYRPSAESLGRRIINGKGIYRLTTLIDIINLISIKSGYSIGGFDNDKICGDSLLLDIGRQSDTFNAIGRGILNIEGLPVFRDKLGGIGTPTSDEERTKLTSETTNLLMLVNIYKEEDSPESIDSLTKTLLSYYANLTDYKSRIISV